MNQYPKKSETKRLHAILLNIGIPPNLLGYEYIVHAIALILINPEYMRHITKGLYIDIASRYFTTPSKVERAIRHCINVAWTQGNLSVIHQIFKNSVNPNKGIPTNSHFLAGIYYYLVLNEQE